MGRIKHILLVSILILLPIKILAEQLLWEVSKPEENDTVIYEAKVQGIISSGMYAPFWLQTGNYGAISAQPQSLNLSLQIAKEATQPNRWYDYGFGVQTIMQIDTKENNIFLQQLYAKARILCFDFTVGVKPEVWGNQDKELSSGGFLFSKNARPIPRMSIGISNYTPIPFSYGMLEVKGELTHGLFNDNIYINKPYLHHKYLGLRIGGKLPVNINYEFHHVAQWGGESPKYGDLGNSWNNFKNVFFANPGGKMTNDQLNALGNHIGSQNIGIDVKSSRWKISGYWQQIFEDSPIRKMWQATNIPDGLWGISVHQSKYPVITGFIYEYINTTDQSGPFHDKDGVIFGGNDSYFNNSIYKNGWNHHLRTIGTPFITSPIYNSDGSISTLNNRVQAHYFAIRGNIKGYKYLTSASRAKNYGINASNTSLLSINKAFLLKVEKHYPQFLNLNFSVSLAADFGSQFNNSYGIMLSITKRGIL